MQSIMILYTQIFPSVTFSAIHKGIYNCESLKSIKNKHIKSRIFHNDFGIPSYQLKHVFRTYIRILHWIRVLNTICGNNMRQ